MKKSDLESGMVIETKDGRIGLIIKGTKGIYRDLIIWADNGFGTLKDFTEELTPYENDLYLEIVRVYNFLSWGVGLGKIADEILRKNLKLIWERKKEIDWSKVPKWTKVRCKGEFGYYNAYHYEYIPNEIHCFGHTTRDEFTFGTDPVVDYLSKRDTYEIHPSVKIQEEWYKE
ncbi:hypothetical protein [Clostridium perfringens]|uniref:hypothetical protein n=1 Tax=Clostridium perfringens TaxID=1502 RepID=UPI002978D9B6|nr:hypothetical protein [Clostridium perfringens]MDM0581946.1 hypothetical protein [Clostridium perfringens]MDM0588287.1 hypothetical protein [Clostridium perfringens]MDM0594376.1 hypothetical protein [Clostridium perfringens]MDM0597408.1 hypothetical protein [Clostridium perfringens]